ncbi:alpha/beta fold hydrolase [Herbiconiux sp. UC225_62]|uniref:alpha/beta fold hydrolase n=1 Tax=Herbiconiux sp. UC225_62 TaxID=3350168 RepID=UPI0036D30FA7
MAEAGRQQPRSSLIESAGMWFRVLSTVEGGARAVPDASTGRDGRAHVLVHGIGTSHRYLSRLHDEFARTGPVHSIDLPGFGGLPKPPEAPSVPEMAAALADVLDGLGLRRPVLVGHSMGAQWVVELAATRADLASAVVAIGPVADDRHRTLTAQSVALGIDILGEPPVVNAVVFLDYLRCGPAWFLRESGPMLSYPIDERVADLTVPLLVVRGGNDPIAGTAWCRRLRDAAPRGSLAVVPGHRHVVQFTAPRAVASAISTFLAAQSDAADTAH